MKPLIITLLLLTGCTVANLPEYFEWGVKVCENNGGLVRLERRSGFWPNAYCNNGAKFNGIGSDFGK